MSNLVQSQAPPPSPPFRSERIIPGIPDPVVIVTRFRRSRATVSPATIDAYHRRLPPSIVFSCSFPLSVQLSVYHRTQSFPPTLVHRYHSFEVTWRPVDCQPPRIRAALLDMQFSCHPSPSPPTIRFHCLSKPSIFLNKSNPILAF